MFLPLWIHHQRASAGKPVLPSRYCANGGISLKAPVELPRIPMTLIWPGEGVLITSVPRLLAIEDPYRSVSTNDVWPVAGSVIWPDRRNAPVSSRIVIVAVRGWMERLAKATPVALPFVLSNERM